jgi:hypothetical protein
MRLSPLWIVLGVVLVGCAEGNPGVLDHRLRKDGQVTKWDGYLWPDLGPPPDGFTWPDLRDGAADKPRPDLRGPDSKPWPDGHLPCNDSFEPNNTCAVASSIGSTLEGSGWATTTATLDPATDADWYAAKGTEKSHTCVPFTSQCFYFKVRVDVPTGRRFKVCVYKDTCSGASSCVNNQATPGPIQLNVQYKVDGTCALDDDTEARIAVTPMDSSGGCPPYNIAYRYDEC